MASIIIYTCALRNNLVAPLNERASSGVWRAIAATDNHVGLGWCAILPSFPSRLTPYPFAGGLSTIANEAPASPSKQTLFYSEIVSHLTHITTPCARAPAKPLSLAAGGSPRGRERSDATFANKTRFCERDVVCAFQPVETPSAERDVCFQTSRHRALSHTRRPLSFCLASATSLLTFAAGNVYYSDQHGTGAAEEERGITPSVRAHKPPINQISNLNRLHQKGTTQPTNHHTHVHARGIIVRQIITREARRFILGSDADVRKHLPPRVSPFHSGCA